MNEHATVRSVLIITNDLECQQTLRRVLSPGHYQISAAPKWHIGVALARESAPDLVMVDYDLPGIGGSALAARLRAVPELAESAIVALTHGGLEEQVLAAGCSGTILKPLNPRLLAQEVDAFFRVKAQSLPSQGRVKELESLVQDLVAQLEEQTVKLETSERRLQEANQLRGSFLIGVSRELRTPLTLISGYVTLLQSTVSMLEGVEQPLSLSEMVEGMAQGTRRMNDVVQELMRVSRIVTGDVSLAIGPARVGTLVSSAVDEFSAEERALIQVKDLSHLPLIGADGNQIRLAMRNILAHLLGHLPEKGRILIDGEHQADVVIVSFTGTGVEIDPAEQDTLFDRLYPRLERKAEDQSGPGVGFGLAVTRGIIQAHNGRIWVESSLQGEQVQSSFHLLLPA